MFQCIFQESHAGLVYYNLSLLSLAMAEAFIQVKGLYIHNIKILFMIKLKKFLVIYIECKFQFFILWSFLFPQYSFIFSLYLFFLSSVHFKPAFSLSYPGFLSFLTFFLEKRFFQLLYLSL